ncbi:MAG: PEP-utilizing enzyme [Desulfobacterales bacterium]|jgi:pyruvate,water dikinase
MNEASNDFNGPGKKPVGLRSGRVFKLIVFELAKKRKELIGDKEAMDWTIKGSPAGPGVAEGLASVITSHEDLPTIMPETILVCPHASPVLTPVLPKIKGLVTDTGGLLAPAATIAREYGIPAVVGTSAATDVIDDDDVIRVDGTNGRIMIITRGQRYASWGA